MFCMYINKYVFHHECITIRMYMHLNEYKRMLTIIIMIIVKIMWICRPYLNISPQIMTIMSGSKTWSACYIVTNFLGQTTVVCTSRRMHRNMFAESSSGLHDSVMVQTQLVVCRRWTPQAV